MTHPDILKMERDGFLGEALKVIDKCCICYCVIYEGERYYKVYSDIVCGDCDREYMRNFERIEA